MMQHAKRWAAPLLVVVVALLGAGTAIADSHGPPPPPRGPGATPDPGGPGAPPPPAPVFGDVPPRHPHALAIYEVAARGWAGGYADGTFRPGHAVQRGQMATFLSRALGLAADETASPFSDTAGTVHEPAIVAVWRAGVAAGHPDGTFRPAADVTRGQMAAFFVRAFGIPAAGGAASFSDTAASPHRSAIEALAAAGIAGGFSDGTYRPNAPVTRGQMATFLFRATRAA